MPPGVSYDEPSIGRVAIDLASRGSELGEELMTRAIRACYRTWPGCGIRISAQQYLIGFYERLGFSTVGEGYLEDDIPHIQMFRPWDGMAAWQSRHEAAVHAFADHLRALPAEALQGTESQWGGLQVLEHLMRSESTARGPTWPKKDRQILTICRRAMCIPMPGASNWCARNPTRVGKTPHPVACCRLHPESLVDVEQAVANWLKAIAEGCNQLGAVYASQAWWKVQVFKHPIAGAGIDGYLGIRSGLSATTCIS